MMTTTSRRPVSVLALTVVLAVESVAMLGYLVRVIALLVGQDAQNEADGLAYVICAAVAMLWAALSAIAVWAGRSWVRGAVITWQLMQIVIGIACLEGLVGVAWAGWLLIVLGILGFVLLISPSTTRFLSK